MICPQCQAEYRQGYSSCADCHVALVHELPHADAAPNFFDTPIVPGDPNVDPFCQFWHGDDPRLHAELCTVLDEAGIAHKTVYRTDHLFNINSYKAFQIGVPFSLYEKAGLAVKDAFGTDEETGAIAVPTLPAPPTPEQPENPGYDYDPDTWFPEDATVEIWSGDPAGPAEMLGSSLRENRIHLRCMELDGRTHVFVLPADEDRAREIVREIVEGAPPD